MRKHAVNLIVCWILFSLILTNIIWAKERKANLSATERLHNLSELDESFRVRDGWSSIGLGAASFIAGLLLYNASTNINSGGINYGGGVVYATSLIMGGVGGLFTLGGLSKVFLQKSETKLDYDKIIKLDIDKREAGAKEYLILKDLQIKKFGLTESIIFPEYKKLYLNEINGYLSDYPSNN